MRARHAKAAKKALAFVSYLTFRAPPLADIVWLIRQAGSWVEMEVFVQTSIVILAGSIALGWAVAVALIRWLLQPKSAAQSERQASFRCGGIKAR
jgi:hypothetical protein